MLSPLGYRILVKKIEMERMVNGVYIPTSAVDETLKAVVVSVGPGKKKIDGNFSPMPINVGDIISYKQFSDNEVQINGEKHIILRMEDVEGIYSEEIS